MLIKRIYANNSLRNFSYLISCPETLDTLAIDPFDGRQVYDEAKKNNLVITKIFNSHEHHDHTCGNDELQNLTNAEIYAHHNNLNKIKNLKHLLSENDVINVGNSIKLRCLNTPGHTFAHICLFSNLDGGHLFCGDTLFNAGVGRVDSGSVNDLYKTIFSIILKLPSSTKIYPGHEYLEKNLEFTLNIDPENIKAQKLLEKILPLKAEDRPITTLEIEQETNVFLQAKDSAKFTELRKKRDSW